MSKDYTPAQKRAMIAKAKAKSQSAQLSYSRPKAMRSQVAHHRKPANTYIKGRGDYKSSIGYQIGKDIGGAIGYGAQHLIKFLTGFGDYKVTQNSLMGGLYDPPEVRNLRERCVVVRHREYIADITASSAFTLQSYPINPGLQGSFPWLSQVAEAFEEYYITGMVYEYKTLSADYTTASSAALGFVCMATQYNAYNPVFPDKKTMENYEFSNSAKPSESFVHPIECKRSITPVSELYVRTGAIPSGADQRLYDLGSFQIATGGNSGSGILGELWVTFEVVLCKPKLIESIGYDMLTDHYQLLASGIADVTPLSTSRTLVAGSNLGTTCSSTVLTFPAFVTNGTYLINYQVTGASTSVTAHALSAVGCSFLSVWTNDTASSVNNVTTTSPYYMHMFVVKIVAASATITWATSGTLPTSPTGGDLWITQINGGIST